MLRMKMATFLFIIQIRIIQAPSHTFDAQDTKVFEIVLDDMDYNEENYGENETIRSADLADLKSLAKDAARYEPPRSHAKHHDEHHAANEKQFPNVLTYLRPYAEEIFNPEQEDKPFIAGFKHELDEFFRKATMQTTAVYDTSTGKINQASSKNGRSVRDLERERNHKNSTTNDVAEIYKGIKRVRVKREEMEDRYGTTLDEDMDFFQLIRDQNLTADETETTDKDYIEETRVTAHYDEYDQRETTNETTGGDTTRHFLTSDRWSTLADAEESPEDEQSYDYERFKIEYEQQLEYNVKRGKALNYTETKEPAGEDSPKAALRRIMDLKRPANCTKKELSQIGIKAIECLAYDYQRTRDVATVMNVLVRTWLVLRVWLLIYICIAIPCWCQRGWCCWCFRCKFCFPRKRILYAKQYYAMNPPGIFVRDLKKEEDVRKPITYEATEYEYDTYETFEAALRNI